MGGQGKVHGAYGAQLSTNPSKNDHNEVVVDERPKKVNPAIIQHNPNSQQSHFSFKDKKDDDKQCEGPECKDIGGNDSKHNYQSGQTLDQKLVDRIDVQIEDLDD